MSSSVGSHDMVENAGYFLASSLGPAYASGVALEIGLMGRGGPTNTKGLLVLSNSMVQVGIQVCTPTAAKVGFAVFSFIANSLLGVTYHHENPPPKYVQNTIKGSLIGAGVAVGSKVVMTAFGVSCGPAAVAIGSAAAFYYNYRKNLNAS